MPVTGYQCQATAAATQVCLCRDWMNSPVFTTGIDPPGDRRVVVRLKIAEVAAKQEHSSSPYRPILDPFGSGARSCKSRESPDTQLKRGRALDMPDCLGDTCSVRGTGPKRPFRKRLKTL